MGVESKVFVKKGGKWMKGEPKIIGHYQYRLLENMLDELVEFLNQFQLVSELKEFLAQQRFIRQMVDTSFYLSEFMNFIQLNINNMIEQGNKLIELVNNIQIVQEEQKWLYYVLNGDQNYYRKYEMISKIEIYQFERQRMVDELVPRLFKELVDQVQNVWDGKGVHQVHQISYNVRNQQVEKGQQLINEINRMGQQIDWNLKMIKQTDPCLYQQLKSLRIVLRINTNLKQCHQYQQEQQLFYQKYLQTIQNRMDQMFMQKVKQEMERTQSIVQKLKDCYLKERSRILEKKLVEEGRRKKKQMEGQMLRDEGERKKIYQKYQKQIQQQIDRTYQLKNQIGQVQMEIGDSYDKQLQMDIEYEQPDQQLDHQQRQKSQIDQEQQQNDDPLELQQLDKYYQQLLAIHNSRLEQLYQNYQNPPQIELSRQYYQIIQTDPLMVPDLCVSPVSSLSICILNPLCQLNGIHQKLLMMLLPVNRINQMNDCLLGKSGLLQQLIPMLVRWGMVDKKTLSIIDNESIQVYLDVSQSIASNINMKLRIQTNGLLEHILSSLVNKYQPIFVHLFNLTHLISLFSKQWKVNTKLSGYSYKSKQQNIIRHIVLLRLKQHQQDIFYNVIEPLITELSAKFKSFSSLNQYSMNLKNVLETINVKIQYLWDEQPSFALLYQLQQHLELDQPIPQPIIQAIS